MGGEAYHTAVTCGPAALNSILKWVPISPLINQLLMHVPNFYFSPPASSQISAPCIKRGHGFLLQQENGSCWKGSCLSIFSMPPFLPASTPNFCSFFLGKSEDVHLYVIPSNALLHQLTLLLLPFPTPPLFNPCLFCFSTRYIEMVMHMHLVHILIPTNS